MATSLPGSLRVCCQRNPAASWKSHGRSGRTPAEEASGAPENPTVWHGSCRETSCRCWLCQDYCPNDLRLRRENRHVRIIRHIRLIHHIGIIRHIRLIHHVGIHHVGIICHVGITHCAGITRRVGINHHVVVICHGEGLVRRRCRGCQAWAHRTRRAAPSGLPSPSPGLLWGDGEGPVPSTDTGRWEPPGSGVV